MYVVYVKVNHFLLWSVCLYVFQKATILSYPTHSAFVLDMRMAKNPENVRTFLEDLSKKLQPLKEQETELFLQYKKADVSR